MTTTYVTDYDTDTDGFERIGSCPEEAIGHLQQLSGSETTYAEAAALYDILTDRGIIRLAATHDGYEMAELTDDEYYAYLGEALAAVRHQADDDVEAARADLSSARRRAGQLIGDASATYRAAVRRSHELHGTSVRGTARRLGLSEATVRGLLAQD